MTKGRDSHDKAAAHSSDLQNRFRRNSHGAPAVSSSGNRALLECLASARHPVSSHARSGHRSDEKSSRFAAQAAEYQRDRIRSDYGYHRILRHVCLRFHSRGSGFPFRLASASPMGVHRRRSRLSDRLCPVCGGTAGKRLSLTDCGNSGKPKSD